MFVLLIQEMFMYISLYEELHPPRICEHGFRKNPGECERKESQVCVSRFDTLHCSSLALDFVAKV